MRAAYHFLLYLVSILWTSALLMELATFVPERFMLLYVVLSITIVASIVAVFTERITT